MTLAEIVILLLIAAVAVLQIAVFLRRPAAYESPHFVKLQRELKGENEEQQQVSTRLILYESSVLYIH